MDRKNPPSLPSDEKDRIEEVYELDILDTQQDKDLDDLTAFAAKLFDVPIVLITILDDHRQWFKSNYGLDVKETEKSISFCQYTILQKEFFEIENAAKDPRFEDNPLVNSSPNIRFYAGTPLVNENGYAIGSLALIDHKPRKLTQEEKHTLQIFGKQANNFFDLILKKKELEKEKMKLENRVNERTSEIKQQLVELKNRDNKLIALNSELSRFIYKLSHDLLGPVKSMQGLTNIALDEVEQPIIHKYLELMQKTEAKLDKTLISLIKLISIKDPWDITEINWQDLMNNSIKNARQRIPDKEVKFKVDIKTKEKFYSDELLLQMMIEEFLVNSIQFNYLSNPVIRISIQDVKDNILIEILDNGIGIREEEKDKIFEMFYKSESSYGSGLGLYIAKNIVEKLGGNITLETYKNTGTLFRILIPLQLNKQR